MIPVFNRIVSLAGRSLNGRCRMRPAITELRRAFDNGEFVLHYQPIVRLADGNMVGAEALLRWNRPSDGLAPPAFFLPVLEESGLIVEIGCWAAREAARQLYSWRTLYGRDIVEWVGVNLSPQQLDDAAPLLRALRTLDDCGLAVHRLKLEIGESVLLQRGERIRALLAELEPLGVHIAVEEFSGACMPLLRGMVDAVKVNAGPGCHLAAPDGEALRETLRDLTLADTVAVVAKGIERIEQCEMLRGCGCGLGQGYLFADPMEGALLGAFALSRAVGPGRPSRRGADRALNPPTSRDQSRAG